MTEIRGPEGREGRPGREGPAGREGLPGIQGESIEGPQGDKGDTGRILPISIKLAFIIVTILFFITVLGFSFVAVQANNLSDDITQMKQRLDKLECPKQPCLTTKG